MYEAVGVAAVQAYAGLVEDVERPHEAAAERGTEVDALALAAGEGVRHAVQREVAQTHVEQELQAAGNLGEQAARHTQLVVAQLQLPEPLLQTGDGHLYQVGDAATVYLHIVGLGLQARAVAYRTGGLAPVTTQHHAVLYLVLVLLHHLEEGVDAGFLLQTAVAGQTVPQPVLLLLRQRVVRLEDREVVLGGMLYEPVFPLAHLLAVPGHHAAVVDGERGIGDDQVLIDADNLAEALAFRTGAHGRIEREHLVGRLLEGDAVGLEARAEIIAQPGRQHHEPQLAVSFEEGRLRRVDQPADGILLN